MVLATNKQQNKSYNFKGVLLQPYKSDFILSMIEEFEVHESRNHWKLIKKSKVNNKHKNKDGNLKTSLYIRSFKRKGFPYGRLMKHEYRICAHGLIQKWVVKYW